MSIIIHERVITGEEIVAAARKWVNPPTPYQHQASVRGIGADCIGLIRGIARDLGLRDPFITGEAHAYYGYSTNPHPALMQACREFMDEVAIPLTGDVLVLRYLREPQHFALLSSNDPAYMIHSTISAGRVVEHRIDPKWQRRILRAFRLRGLN